MSSFRLKRFEKVLASLIQEWFCYHNNLIEVKSFDFTIEKIQVSPDLRNAKVFITSMGKQESILKDFEVARPSIQRYISKNMQSKATPKIRFVYDKTSEILKSLPPEDFQ